LFGRIPGAGESIEDDNYVFEITKATNKQIEEIKVKKKNDSG